MEYNDRTHTGFKTGKWEKSNSNYTAKALAVAAIGLLVLTCNSLTQNGIEFGGVATGNLEDLGIPNDPLAPSIAEQ